MLPARHRLRDPAGFRDAVRRGRRVGGNAVVVHLRTTREATPPLVGFVVSRAVGPAVTRNLVKRRLRHLMRDRLGALAEGSLLVVRAQPGAATLTSAQLGAELDRALARLTAGSHR